MIVGVGHSQHIMGPEHLPTPATAADANLLTHRHAMARKPHQEKPPWEGNPVLRTNSVRAGVGSPEHRDCCEAKLFETQTVRPARLTEHQEAVLRHSEGTANLRTLHPAPRAASSNNFFFFFDVVAYLASSTETCLWLLLSYTATSLARWSTATAPAPFVSKLALRTGVEPTIWPSSMTWIFRRTFRKG